MSSIYDIINVEKNPRCAHIKGAIVIINLVGAPASFIILIICLIRMSKNKKKSFLTYIIIFIFCSEIMNTISKMLQILKYSFPDTRDNGKDNSEETPRGIICQIQIVISIYSDFCSLLGTLLLSFRCYDLIKNKQKIFSRKKSRIISFCFIIFFSLILSILFLFIDRILTHNSKAYKFDLRDRCSYWCWLDHTSSLICYSLYLIIIVLIIIYACRTNSLLKQLSKIILEQSVVFLENSVASNDKKNHDDRNAVEEKGLITKEDKKKIKNVRFMRIKVLIYPWIGIIIWGLSTIYRMTDDIMMRKIDDEELGQERSSEESDMFDNRPGFQFFVELFMVLHTILSSIRGILYGFSFIIFEDKCFGKCLRKCTYKCCCKNEDLDKYDDVEENEGDSSGNSTEPIMTQSKVTDTNENEDDFRQSNASKIVLKKD